MRVLLITFQEALWKYFSNPDLCEKHGARGRKHILENYKWEKVVKDFKNNVLDKFIIKKNDYNNFI